MAKHPRPADLERLAADLGVLDATGIERAAWGWDRHESRGLDAYHRAEKAALAAIERAGLGEEWQAYHRRVFGLTEAKTALVAWKGMHGERGHVSADDYAALVEPMAEALPWLLPKQRPAPRT